MDDSNYTGGADLYSFLKDEVVRPRPCEEGIVLSDTQKMNLRRMVLEQITAAEMTREALLSPTTIDISQIPVEDRDREMLRLAIIAEYDATNLYEQMAAMTENEEIRKTMLSVAKEEKTHVGEFQALLEGIDPELTAELDKGKKETTASSNEDNLDEAGMKALNSLSEALKVLGIYDEDQDDVFHNAVGSVREAYDTLKEAFDFYSLASYYKTAAEDLYTCTECGWRGNDPIILNGNEYGCPECGGEELSMDNPQYAEGEEYDVYPRNINHAENPFDVMKEANKADDAAAEVERELARGRGGKKKKNNRSHKGGDSSDSGEGLGGGGYAGQGGGAGGASTGGTGGGSGGSGGGA